MYQIRPNSIIFIVVFIFVINHLSRYYTSFDLYELLNVIFTRIINFEILQFKPIIVRSNVKFIYHRNDNIQFGKYIFINKGTIITSTFNSKIVIKDKCMIGPNVSIIADTHETSRDFLKRALPLSKTIIIEENVWICTGAIIVGGVTIGKNSIIGAGAVVSNSIPPNCLALGVPAKVKRFLK
jgi:acetyltransferase-like isoleucine patch superfamily enzyme